MKTRFCVKKKKLLLIAGVNVARLGVISYLNIDRKTYLYLMSIIAFFYSGLGLALALAGIIFTRNYLFYNKLIEKEQN